jgi:hypothetical protein
MHIWRLFVGAKRTNSTGEYILASWSYVTGYWRWVIYWSRAPRDGATAKRVGFFKRANYCRQAWIALPMLGRLSIQTQPPMESMKRPYPASSVGRP